MSSLQDWTEYDVGSGLKLLSGFPFESSLFSDEDGFPLIRIRDVLESQIGTYYLGQVLSPYVIKFGDLLVAMDGDFHVARWRNQDALLNQRVLKVEISSVGQLDLDFIYYWLQPYIKKVNELTAATTVKHLSTKDIVKARGKLPPLRVQQKIAHILKTIDQAIEKTEQLIEKYQQIKAGLMHDLFTRGIGTDGKLRPPREQAPELYQETAIGWIPKEWKCLPLRDILSTEGGYLQTGPFGSQLHAHEYQPEGISVVMPQNIENGCISISQISYISESRAIDLAKHRMKVGDIVISRRGDLSRSAAIQKHEIGWVCGTGCFLLRLATTQLSPEFVSLCYRQSFIQRQVEGLSVGSTMPSLNNEIMGKLRFPYCSLDEQMKIVRKVSIIDLKISTHVSELEKLRLQKSGLMHDLLTGKVTVSVEPVKATLSLEQGAA